MRTKSCKVPRAIVANFYEAKRNFASAGTIDFEWAPGFSNKILRIFVGREVSFIFVEKPWNSCISSNIVCIMFAHYCNHLPSYCSSEALQTGPSFWLASCSATSLSCAFKDGLEKLKCCLELKGFNFVNVIRVSEGQRFWLQKRPGQYTASRLSYRSVNAVATMPKGITGSGSALFKLIEIHVVSVRWKEKPQMNAFMTFPSVLLKHRQLRSNNSKLTLPIIPPGILSGNLSPISYILTGLM